MGPLSSCGGATTGFGDECAGCTTADEPKWDDSDDAKPHDWALVKCDPDAAKWRYGVVESRYEPCGHEAIEFAGKSRPSQDSEPLCGP